VALDARGRVVVTDFDAAAAEWSSIHVPSVAEMMRGSPAHAPAAPMPPPPDFFADLSKQDLLERWVAYDLLANALILDTLGTESDQLADDAFIERTTALLRRIAPLWCADQETQAGAETLLRELVADVVGEVREELLGSTTARRQEDDAAAVAAVAAVAYAAAAPRRPNRSAVRRHRVR
jgi:hypothetical protein